MEKMQCQRQVGFISEIGTLLHAAASYSTVQYKGHVDTVALHHGANVNATDEDTVREPPLCSAYHGWTSGGYVAIAGARSRRAVA
jgi:hypothetical protein